VSTHGPAVRARLGLAWAIAIAAAALFVVAGALTATTRYQDTLARYDRGTALADEVKIEVPTTWRLVREPADAKAPQPDAVSDQLEDPDHLAGLSLVRVPGPADAAFATWRDDARARARAYGFDDAVAADDTIIHLPAGWLSAELIATVEDELGTTQRFRVILFAHGDGRQTVLGALYVPDVLARDARDGFTAILASARPAV